MSNKHTPGPWHVGMNPGPIIYGPLGEQIADCRDSAEFLDKSENGYNARLVAAAPQLLELLTAAREAYLSGNQDDLQGILTGDVCSELLGK